ncbi:DUF4865 family protein [Celerinatantimonas yamalensis]|uniref:DUF4865 family protein n=1 Tax=Celerinatantimonas yamalensis TaxID=559956 RepID=A0ABW9G6E9_9GAMM
MIAMQYSFEFPADYDMDIIRRRISDNGHLLNGFPDLLAKLYLFARRDDPECQSAKNIYAPFYIWRQTQGMQDFLASKGFEALCEHFGRPHVNLWLPNNTVNLELLTQQKTLSISQQTLHHGLPTQVSSDEILLSGYSPFAGENWETLKISAHKKTDMMWQNYRVGYVATNEK